MWNADPKNPEMPWKYAGAVDIPVSFYLCFFPHSFKINLGSCFTDREPPQLSEIGINEAMAAGKKMKHIPLDVVYCSMLTRAQTTALISLACHNSKKAPLIVRDSEDEASRGITKKMEKINEKSHSEIIPMYCSNLLNERGFGDLQGVYESAQAEMVSPDELRRYRCEWDARFPNGESSKDVQERTLEFFDRHIRPQLKAGKNVLFVCHAFVVRVLLKYMYNLSDKEWYRQMALESDHKLRKYSVLRIPNAHPVVFKYVGDPNGPERYSDFLQIKRLDSAEIGYVEDKSIKPGTSKL